jgi:alkylation response protein AidB-like acyl-CoA dehydrogenase
MVRSLADNVIKPRAAEIDEKAEYPQDVRQALAAQELLGLPIPERYGGGGADSISQQIVIEEVSRACVSSSLIVAVQELGTRPIMDFGDEELKQRYLPGAARGETIAAFALSEPSSGSDATTMRTTARRDGDDYIINGTKIFITNAGVADFYVVHTLTDPGAGARGTTSFVVDADTPGFRVTRLEKKMGIRGSPTGELLFEDCRVPARNRIGEEGSGVRVALGTLDHTRIGIGAQAVGVAQGALDEAIAFAKERIAFGKPISEFQGIQFMLADMAIAVETARTMVYRAAAAADAHEPGWQQLSAIAKCYASDMAMKVTTDAVQVLGGYGFVQDRPVERMMRDAKVCQIYEGTNQIQRVVIARGLLR